MDKCSECSREWEQRYNLAVRRFDKSLNTAMIVTIILACITLVSVIITASCLAKTLSFIKEFEYVEETVVDQDGDGQNFAVLIDNDVKSK